MLSKVRVATMVTMVTWPAVKWWTSREHEHASRLRLLRKLAEFSSWPKQELFESFVMFKQHLRALQQSEKVSRVLRFEPRTAGREVKMSPLSWVAQPPWPTQELILWADYARYCSNCSESMFRPLLVASPMGGLAEVAGKQLEPRFGLLAFMPWNSKPALFLSNPSTIGTTNFMLWYCQATTVWTYHGLPPWLSESLTWRQDQSA